MLKDIRLLFVLMKSFWNWVVMTAINAMSTAKHWIEYFKMATMVMLTYMLDEVLNVLIDMRCLES